MSTRKNIATGAPWEDIVGYCRAVHIGHTVEISGSVAVDHNGQLAGAGSVYEQTRFIILKAQQVLEQVGFSLADVVRTRVYVIDIARWEEVGRAHGEFFKDIKPATSMIQVSALIGPEYLVEIEFTAIKS
ncbi:MAG: RidA family protein [Cyclobacteriaceae bacterium]|jgi:enamine deaminase RidA (YjgF/YER057c/UK114 family)|nr:RidA family protein [Cyclobacteriaceae bacterium]